MQHYRTENIHPDGIHCKNKLVLTTEWLPQYTENPHNICASLTWLQVSYCNYKVHLTPSQIDVLRAVSVHIVVVRWNWAAAY